MQILLICLSLFAKVLFAQDDKPTLMLGLNHYTVNNNLQYLIVKTQVKANNKIQPVKDAVVKLYLDSVSESNLISNVKTDEKGFAEANIPSQLKNIWTSSPNHKFFAITKLSPKDEETTTELDIAKSKIEIDTANEDGARMVKAKIFSYNNGEWIPTKGVEVKLGVERLGGSLKIGESESYTTDSLGKVSGEFKIDSLPAIDAKGNIVLVAKVEDNDQFGNLSIEKTVPWGKYYKRTTTFGQRALWAGRFKSPIWLLLMAYSIVGAVWSVIIYLLFQIYKMKKSGKEEIVSDAPVEIEKMYA